MSLLWSALVSAVAGLLVTSLFTYYKLRWRWRHVRDILSFEGEDVVLVVPHRDREPNSIMPRVAAEDVLAMMNVVQMMTRAGVKAKFKVKDNKHLTDDDKKKNLITFGGAKVNDYTDWLLHKATAASLEFERDPSELRFILKRQANRTYTSPSYQMPDGTAPEIAREDVAFIIKFRNPRNDAGKTIVIAIAGLRGIGTWGAADCLRKKFRELHARKRRGDRFSKTGDFITMLSVEYENYDIVGTRIIEFEDLS